MAYIDQFDHLVREADRGRAIRSTRTIAVFGDGLVICAVTVYGGSRPAGMLRRFAGGQKQSGDGENAVRRTVERLGAEASARELAEDWPKAAVIPFDGIESVVLTRPVKVTRLAIREQLAGSEQATESAYLGDLDAERVRAVLGPLLGERLRIEFPAA